MKIQYLYSKEKFNTINLLLLSTFQLTVDHKYDEMIFCMFFYLITKKRKEGYDCQKIGFLICVSCDTFF